MTYEQFLAAHPELEGLDQGTIDMAYDQYLECLNESMTMED